MINNKDSFISVDSEICFKSKTPKGTYYLCCLLLTDWGTINEISMRPHTNHSNQLGKFTMVSKPIDLG